MLKDETKTDLSAFVSLGFAIIILLICVYLIPDSPKLVITKPNQPSFRGAEVEPKPGMYLSVMDSPVRRSLGFFEVTAYCPCEICCGQWSDGITASSHRIQLGDKFCAADPIFPFGVKLDIPGYGFVPVLDRGGAITGRALDVFFPTHQEALEWGRQELEIFCWVRDD